MVFSWPVIFQFNEPPESDPDTLTQLSMPDSISVPSS